MKDNLYLILMLVSALIVVAICAWISMTVWNSDLPDWLKFLILK